MSKKATNNSQIFKHKVLTEKQVVKNILKIYGKATNQHKAQDWYKEANKLAIDFAYLFNIQINQAAGIIASLSPIKSWNENKDCAFSFLEYGHAKHTACFTQKARDILRATEDKAILKILNGLKIRSFFTNIVHPDKAKDVTIDRHAVSISLNRWITDNESLSLTKKQYNFFVDCYIKAAKRIGIRPSLLQSITWCTFREIKEEYR